MKYHEQQFGVSSQIDAAEEASGDSSDAGDTSDSG